MHNVQMSLAFYNFIEFAFRTMLKNYDADFLGSDKLPILEAKTVTKRWNSSNLKEYSTSHMKRRLAWKCGQRQNYIHSTYYFRYNKDKLEKQLKKLLVYLFDVLTSVEYEFKLQAKFFIDKKMLKLVKFWALKFNFEGLETKMK